MEGYNPDILDEIYEEERDEVEDIIWEAFKEDDSAISIFLPKLKNYKGIEELDKALLKCKVPSGRSIELASVLYAYTNDESYLDVFISKFKNR